MRTDLFCISNKLQCPHKAELGLLCVDRLLQDLLNKEMHGLDLDLFCLKAIRQGSTEILTIWNHERDSSDFNQKGSLFAHSVSDSIIDERVQQALVELQFYRALSICVVSIFVLIDLVANDVRIHDVVCALAGSV